MRRLRSEARRCAKPNPLRGHAVPLRVCYRGAEGTEARLSIELTREDATGWGGYQVCGVASDTGHDADTLNEMLRTFRRLAIEGAAAVLRETERTAAGFGKALPRA